jgi:UTP--glucose-1-phosphate uridylyltransferase
LWSSGVLDSLLHDGKEYAFISNIDNLTATIDLDMLYHLYCNDVEMCMEVTSPNRTDNDGGYMVKKAGSEGTRFIEVNEVAMEDREEFKRTFKHYNTNNLWVNLRALKRQIEAGDYGDTVIAQERILESKSMKVLQLETTAGSLINKMQNTLAVVVERRKRYVPVKTTADLMLIQSNIFSIKHGALHLNPSLIAMPLPTVKLGKEFTDIDDYVRRIPIQQHHTANIAELEHLTIAGDVYIGKNVTLKGTGRY